MIRSILPLILIDPAKYVIKGSFRRRAPYVTDIDVINEVYPRISSSNIYGELLRTLDRIERRSDIILVNVTCGVDDRFKLKSGSQSEIQDIIPLIRHEDAVKLEEVMLKYSDDNDRRLFYLNEIIWCYYKLRWTVPEVRLGMKKLPGNRTVELQQQFDSKANLLLQYFIKIKSYPIGIDVAVKYTPADFTAVYDQAHNYQLSLANYEQEFYYLHFFLRHEFKSDRKIYHQIDNIIERKFGLYKQLMVRIDGFDTLLKSRYLDDALALTIATNIASDSANLGAAAGSEVKAAALDLIRAVKAAAKPSELQNIMMRLYDALTLSVNKQARESFFYYLGKLPRDTARKIYFVDQLNVK